MTKNTKTLLWVAGLGVVAYYFWMKNKKAQVAAPKASEAAWTGDLNVPEYQNAKGSPKFGPIVPTPSGLGRLGERLTFR